MLFRLCEHYDDPIYQDKIQCYNECFICLEGKIDSENNPSTLKTHKLYIDNCTCNASVHIECLKIWIDKNKSCPICRIHVIENNNATTIVFNYIHFGISIYNFTKKISLKALRFLSVVFFIYSLLDLYFLSIKTKYADQNEYNYISIAILENKYGEIFNNSNENIN